MDLVGKTFAIVGGMGIGKAHAIAAINLGMVLKYVVDIDPTCKSVYNSGKIVNEWDLIKEEASIPYKVDFYLPENFIEYWIPAVDLIFVCTPNSSHEYYTLLALSKANKVLVEKPMSFNDEIFPTRIGEWKKLGYSSRINVGHEWLYGNVGKYIRKNEISYLYQFHNSPMPKVGWRTNDHIAYDLGSHLLAYALYHFNDYNANAYKVDVIDLEDNRIAFGIEHLGLERGIVCQAFYNPSKQGFETLGGHNTNCSIYDCEVIVDRKAFGWEPDLFQNQIIGIMNEALAPYELGLCIDRLIFRHFMPLIRNKK